MRPSWWWSAVLGRPGWGNSVISGGVLHAVLRDPRAAPEQLLATIMELTDGHADRCRRRRLGPQRSTDDRLDRGARRQLMTDPRFPLRARVFSPVRPTVPGVQSEGFGTENFLTHLAQTVASNGGTIRQPARAMALVADGPSWGVDLAVDGGSGASHGPQAVVLCDGGFQAAPDLLRQYVGTDQVKLRAADTGVGDGLRMGLSAGGVAVQMRGFYGHVLARGALDNDALWPYPILDQLAAVGIVVGPRGDRFVDEGYSGVNTTNQIAWSATPLDNWLIVDDEAWEHHGREGVTPPNPHIAAARRGASQRAHDRTCWRPWPALILAASPTPWPNCPEARRPPPRPAAATCTWTSSRSTPSPSWPA